MLGLFNDSREGIGSRVTHHPAHNWPTEPYQYAWIAYEYTLKITPAA